MKWKKIFSLTLIAFQICSFTTNNVHAESNHDDNIITLADLHESKYDLNTNTRISFGKLYSSTPSTNIKRYSPMTEDNDGHWIDVSDGHEGSLEMPDTINPGMSFNPETTPWQNRGVTVDFALTGDDTAILEKSALRCYDTKVVGGNSSIEYATQVGKDNADYKTNVMQGGMIVDNSDKWDYYEHGDGWGYGTYREKNGIKDGKWGASVGVTSGLKSWYKNVLHDGEDPKDYDKISDLDDDDIKDLYPDYIQYLEEEKDPPHLYILCRSSGTKWTRIHQMYAVSKIQFSVVHAEDVNGHDVTSKVAIDDSGIQYNTTNINPTNFYNQYSNSSVNGNSAYGGSPGATYGVGTLNMNRVHGTLKIDGKNGYKNVAANIVINAKIVEWKQIGWGYLESIEKGPVGQDVTNWPQFARVYTNFDVSSSGHWWNNTGYNWSGSWKDGYWNDDRSFNLAKSPGSSNGFASENINLAYEKNSYDSFDDGYNIDETDPYDLVSKEWWDYNTGKTYHRGQFGVIGNWVNNDITTQIYAKDNLSGIDTDRSYVTINDRSWYNRDDSTKHYFDPDTEDIKTGYKIYDLQDELTFTDDGIYYAEGKLWDIADNYHFDSHGAYKLDKTNPDIPVFSDDNRTYIDDPYAINVTLKDNLSGVDRVRWCVTRNTPTYNNESTNLENLTTPENSPNATTNFNVPINSNGTWYIHVWVYDRAGNVTYKVSNGYKFFKITPGDVTVDPTPNGSNILRGTRFDVVTKIPYFTQEAGNNSTLHYIMPNWVNDEVDKKVNGNYAITPGTGTDTHCSQYGPPDQAILWKAYVVPYGVPLTKDRDGNVIGPYQQVVIRLQYTNYIYGEKITHDLPINYSIIPEVIVKTEIINNPL